MEGEATRGASRGKATAGKAVSCCQLSCALYTYRVQRSSTRQGQIKTGTA